MEHSRRQELQSEDASERTTRMMRSVREILAEQGQDHLLDEANFEAASEAATMPPRPMPGAAMAACAAAKGGVQRPPHLRGAISAPTPKVSEQPTPVAPAPEKSRSLFSRLIGR